MTASTDPHRPGPVSIEDVVRALSGECDGARSRDGRGFSRADAVEGGRLMAIKAAGLAWSVDDARKAKEIVGRYADQAGALLGLGRKGREDGIASAVREGRVRLRDLPTNRQEPYNYACLSPGGKRVYLWRLTRVVDLGLLARELRQAAATPHGARRVGFDLDVTATITLNGREVRAARMEVDLVGTNREAVLAILDRHGFLVEPAVTLPLDPEVDALRMQAKAGWGARGTRRGRTGDWAVLDLASKDTSFSHDMKTYMRGRFVCDENDDWNWWCELDRGTVPTLSALVRRHGFALARDLAQVLVGPVR